MSKLVKMSPRELKDLRKTCATYYDEHVPESSVEILGHSVGGITYRHYAHRAPLAFKAIMTIPQPTAFSALLKGHDGECPCCRRPFADAGWMWAMGPESASSRARLHSVGRTGARKVQVASRRIAWAIGSTGATTQPSGSPLRLSRLA
jgi:hypothetical protein